MQAFLDVMVSLCKLKQHLRAGVTLSMKNQFGNTPNSQARGRRPDHRKSPLFLYLS
jgi:uncharacterized protein (DUF362 family)